MFGDQAQSKGIRGSAQTKKLRVKSSAIFELFCKIEKLYLTTHQFRLMDLFRVNSLFMCKKMK